MMKIIRFSLLSWVLAFFSVFSLSQTVVPFALRFQVAAKGNIAYVSNTILECNGTGTGGANCADLATQLPPTFSTWSQNNDHVADYVDIDVDPATFSSSADSLILDACSEVLFAGVYWGGRSNNADPGFSLRNSILIQANNTGYLPIDADVLIDAGAADGLANQVYYCFADITDLVNANPLESEYMAGNIYSHLDGGNDRWGGWNIVVVYKNDLLPMRQLNVLDGLVNVNNISTDVESVISGFLTPTVGPVNFELGVFSYDGDRGFNGDSLLFDGGSGFVEIDNALNPAGDIFNSSQTRKGVVSTSQTPLIHNSISIDADVFAPDNSTFSYIGNGATEATVKITSANENLQVQVITLAIDTQEPDIRAEVRAEDLNGGDILAGDTLEYTVVGTNTGSGVATDMYIIDTLAQNTIYVPNSVEIVFGPNLGTKTDAGGDDQAVYNAADNTLRVNIGAGASAAVGGDVTDSPTGLDSTVFTFRTVVTDDCVYLSCDNEIENRAYIFGVGDDSGTMFSNGSNPGLVDGDGCPITGPTSLTVNTASCTLPTDTLITDYCADAVFADFPYDESGYSYFDDGYAPAVAATAPGTFYAIYEPFLGCADTVEMVVDAYIDAPTTANAGPDQVTCVDPGTATLAGNNPAIGTGLWTVVAGGATLTDPTLFNTTVTGLTAGENTFAWTITNDPCPGSSTDEVTINVDELPSTPNAGLDQEICGDPVTTLNADVPAVGGGMWEVLSGDGFLTDPTNFDSDIEDLSFGENLLRWTITHGTCPPEFDEVSIFLLVDTDGDGICDVDDVDDDNDGIIDTEEGADDADNDGLSNALDLDSDNDGIADIVEAGGTDANGDGLVDDPTDIDDDGLANTHDADDGGVPLVGIDSDNDGVKNRLDLDSDNDGIPDVLEAGGTDANGDGVLDDVTDTDADGFADVVDTDDNTIPGEGDGGVSLVDNDTDDDGIKNRLDLDSDNDGIADVTENNGADTNGDGVLDAFTDIDGDGFSDVVDTDDNTIPGTGDGGISLGHDDFDRDGHPNYIDLDADNDGIYDVIEAGGTDADLDGLLDAFADVDADGFSDVVDTDDNTVPGVGDGGTALPLPNTDAVTRANFLDIDSDGDGIADHIEAQPTAGYTPFAPADSDNDGMNDAFDADAGGTPLNPFDFELDGTPCYIDTDADDDGELDILEAWDADGDGVADITPAGSDADADGLDDAFDAIVLSIATATVNAGNGTVNPLTDGVLADADFPGIGDLDYRENSMDADSDGIPNFLDVDNDNDGIPDLVEDLNLDGDNDPLTNPTNSDTDPLPDFLDLDSDNDGIADIIEAGGIDTNNDGRVDDIDADNHLINDTNTNGLDDLYDTDNGGTALATADTDTDTKRNFQDIDSDNDGLYDIEEDGGIDTDNNGRVDSFEDLNQDGWADSGTTNGLADKDADGVVNFLDLDSDNDGTPDILENGGADENSDGKVDDFTDGDADGAADVGMTVGVLDFDSDGVPNYHDLDSDNDGITDAEENGLPDAEHNGLADDFTDADADGWNDTHKTIVQTNTDGDANTDDTDIDSDNDGIDDIIEGDGTDTNADGVLDDFTDTDNNGLDDEGGLTPPDTDGDGEDDYQDLDADNDTVPDADENDPNGDGTGPDDTDGDGIEDYRDVDDDDDGLLTQDEADADGDMVYDDCDFDGVPDYLDRDECLDGLIIPTGFSPDGDGINDFFVILGIEAYPNATLFVFNRWGSKVYEATQGYNSDWDGTNIFGVAAGTRELPVGTYYYVLDLGDETENEPIKGYVFINK